MSIDLSQNFEWLAIQYQLTNIQDLLQQIGAIQQQYQIDVLAQYSQLFDIDTATGIWLDYVGYRLGVFERPALPGDPTDYFGFDMSGGTGFDQANFVTDTSDTLALNDEDFRAFLKAIAQQLITDCTGEAIRQALLLFFESVIVIDNQNMSMTVTITTARNYYVVQSVIEAGIITKPAAVRIDDQIVFGNHFGFADSGGTGFDQSPFIFTSEV